MMSGKTKIEWADRVWNPVVGCTPVSEGCRNCYAKSLHDMRHKAYLEGKELPVQYAEPFDKVQLMNRRMGDPMGWKTPQRIFVNSVSDLFHPDVPISFLANLFETMASWVLTCKEPYCDHAEKECWVRHTFMVLTKRPEQMHQAITEDIPGFVDQYFPGDYAMAMRGELDNWPLKNLWLGVSVEDQKTADERIPWLLKTPAAVRFVSVEPMLGPVELRKIKGDHVNYNVLERSRFDYGDDGFGVGAPMREGIDWVICGGESGLNGRVMDPLWPSALKNQCVEAGVPFFFKGWGEWAFWGGMMVKVGKERSGRVLDDKQWNEYPDGTGRQSLSRNKLGDAKPAPFAPTSGKGSEL
ncbi:conserved hypothetical protein [Gammaproteobacteria bacterium]